MCLIAADPAYFSASAARGIALFAASVLPSVFPFFFCSTLLTAIGAARALSRLGAKPVRVLFDAPPEGAYALTLSWLSGYPVGAATTADLYACGAVDARGAAKLATVASTSGPAFLMGAVGGAMLDSPGAGALLLAAHYASSVVTGVLLRKFGDRPRKCRASRAAVCALDTDTALADSIRSSALGMLTVGGYVVIGGMLADALSLTGIERAVSALIPGDAANALIGVIYGGIEMTRGCVTAAECASFPLAAASIAFTAAFGGLSVLLQSHSFLSRCGISFRSLFARKLLQGVLAAGITFALALVFNNYLT